ncbi:MAG TPA: biopolymer transporter ExbD [bacterium]|nr:biopolymer transporter ExbD [bacterium]
MAAASSGNGDTISGINVTPLVDVMLVLLVIFMVTARILANPAVGLDLPKAVRTEEVQVVLSVQIPKDGATKVDGAPLASDDELREHAATALARDPELRAVIQADGDVPHRRVVHALDLLKRAGITRVAFAALPEAEEKP